MKTNRFFVCPSCGNVKKFKIFTSNFQIVIQSPDDGICTGESGILPNLRQTDNYVECQLCYKKSEYDIAMDHGKKYLKSLKKPKTANTPI